VLAKPHKEIEPFLEQAKALKKMLVVDICDAHLTIPYYAKAIQSADLITTSTPFTAELIKEDYGLWAVPIDDPYEFEERPPHVNGSKLLWFGHPANFYSLDRFARDLQGYDLHIMTNAEGAIPWSLEGLRQECQRADIVLLPDSAPYKSPNRAVEAVRNGCYVVAEPHPSLEGFPGIWVGSLMKGIEWVISHPKEANEALKVAQSYVRERFSPARVANVWKTTIEASWSIWDAATSHGKAGSTWTATEPAMLPM
jgi:hypothetical protein